MKYSVLVLCLLLLLALASCIRVENGEGDIESETFPVSDTEPETETIPDTETLPETEGDTLPNEADPDHTKRY